MNYSAISFALLVKHLRNPLMDIQHRRTHSFAAWFKAFAPNLEIWTGETVVKVHFNMVA